MKRLVEVICAFCLVLLVSMNVCASHNIIGQFCPDEKICQNNEIQGDDGVCHNCQTVDIITASCIGKERAEKACPNRTVKIVGKMLIVKSDFEGDVDKVVSLLNECPQNEILGNDGKCHRCDEKMPVGIGRFMMADDVLSICPQRIFDEDIQISYYSCGDKLEEYKRSDNQYPICVFRCPQGFRHIDWNGCINDTTLETWYAPVIDE